MARALRPLCLPVDLAENDVRMMLDFLHASTPSTVDGPAMEDHLLTSLALHLRKALLSN